MPRHRLGSGAYFLFFQLHARTLTLLPIIYYVNCVDQTTRQISIHYNLQYTIATHLRY